MRGQKLSDETIKKIIAFRQEGLSRTKIAEKIGVSQTAVYTHLFDLKYNYECRNLMPDYKCKLENFVLSRKNKRSLDISAGYPIRLAGFSKNPGEIFIELKVEKIDKELQDIGICSKDLNYSSEEVERDFSTYLTWLYLEINEENSKQEKINWTRLLEGESLFDVRWVKNEISSKKFFIKPREDGLNGEKRFDLVAFLMAYRTALQKEVKEEKRIRQTNRRIMKYKNSL